jgi:hypothetical protein
MKLNIVTAFLLSMLIGLPVPVFAADSIGIAAIATGTSIEGKGEFKVNDEASVGDIIKTGEKGSVTILFNDESMLTLGPNSSARLDTYKDGSPGESRLTILTGQFRYFPGKILEKGGSQRVINLGASASSGPETNIGITETGLTATTVETNNHVLDVTISELNTIQLNTTAAVLVEATPSAASAQEGAATSIPQDPLQ